MCRKGKMLPDDQEGEPDYTDNFVCQHCQHRDTITTVPNICSQVLTSLVGGGIGVYLLIGVVHELARGAGQDGATAFKIIALLLVACLFITGFAYVLFQAYRGYRQRRAYLTTPALSRPPKKPAKAAAK